MSLMKVLHHWSRPLTSLTTTPGDLASHALLAMDFSLSNYIQFNSLEITLENIFSVRCIRYNESSCYDNYVRPSIHLCV